MLTVDQKLSLLKDSVWMGARISVNFHHNTKEEAKEIIESIAGQIGEGCSLERSGETNWYSVSSDNIDFTAFFYNED